MLWDSVLWDFVLWDFVLRDFVLWDFVLWDSDPDSPKPFANSNRDTGTSNRTTRFSIRAVRSPVSSSPSIVNTWWLLNMFQTIPSRDNRSLSSSVPTRIYFSVITSTPVLVFQIMPSSYEPYCSQYGFSVWLPGKILLTGTSKYSANPWLNKLNWQFKSLHIAMSVKSEPGAEA